MMYIRELAAGLSHLLFPVLCEGCSMPLVAGEEVLCIGCEMQLPETNYHNAADNDTSVRFAGRIPFVKATTYAYFTEDGLLQHLIHGLKYGGKRDNGLYLGEKLGKQLKGCGWAENIDMIIPVPLHPAKERSRGYNQSELIGEGMARAMQIPVATNVLLRNRHTESQTNKSRTERIDNMAGAFGVTDIRVMENKHILLCDDVLTTGATMEACALALMQEKSIKISVATIGIAVS